MGELFPGDPGFDAMWRQKHDNRYWDRVIPDDDSGDTK